MLRSRTTVSRVLSRGRLAYVAIDVGRGPLVTPVLYGALGDDLWFVTNRHALKTKVLGRRPAVGWVVPAADRAVVATGEAQLFSLSDPRAALARAALLRHAPAALVSWVKRNPRQVAGFLGDSVTTPRRALPQDVVLVRLRPTSSSVVPLATPGSEAVVGRPVTAELPAALAHLPASPSGVLGLITSRGPVAVPVGWDGTTATLPDGLEDLVAEAGDAACVTFDDPVRTRPTQQRGVVLRGEARAEPGNRLRWSVVPRRVTYWDGFETETVALAAAPEPVH